MAAGCVPAVSFSFFGPFAALPSEAPAGAFIAILALQAQLPRLFSARAALSFYYVPEDFGVGEAWRGGVEFPLNAEHPSISWAYAKVSEKARRLSVGVGNHGLFFMRSLRMARL